ncbi:hypothetical protein HYPSUDRAFT_59574 [Hypholoma sublateritium FD-334 SS-4]|uniref:Uncharacterized protein n=1 Tax=Hypholoma sublateritium (strain FD-334 SS-4) TaxID=945553 RepID=A0A0D2N4F7_HYPSF|nr:hypothetical protein HYPSUDRAFT_59574 [Hypholoma sublateritium FD-334 SS-4]
MNNDASPGQKSQDSGVNVRLLFSLDMLEGLVTLRLSRNYGRKNVDHANSTSKNKPAASTTAAAVTNSDNGAPSADPAAGLSTATAILLLTHPSPVYQGAPPAQGNPPFQQQLTPSTNDMATMATVIEGQIIKIEEQEKTIHNQTEEISTQTARFLLIEAHIKQLEFTISSNKEAADAQISKVNKKNEIAATEVNELAETVSRQKIKIIDMDKEHHTIKTTLESQIKGIEDTIVVLTLRIEAQDEEIQDMKLYSFREDPLLSLVRIKCRAVIDRGLGIIYEAATGLKPDKKQHHVKKWVAITLNPPGFKGLATLTDSQRTALDLGRYKACCKLLTQGGKMLSPAYIALIQSNTLRFLMQSSIDLRNHANENAHELAQSQISDLRQCLDRAKKDNIIDTICSSSDLSGIEGTMAFIESSFPNLPPVVSSSTTKTTVELKITTETSTVNHKASEH